MLPALLLAASLISFGTNRACDKNSQTQVRPCGFLRDLIFNGRSLRNCICGREASLHRLLEIEVDIVCGMKAPWKMDKEPTPQASYNTC